ncbi:unnamed protein product [Ectocarpus sp. 4 AP-2014]
MKATSRTIRLPYAYCKRRVQSYIGSTKSIGSKTLCGCGRQGDQFLLSLVKVECRRSTESLKRLPLWCLPPPSFDLADQCDRGTTGSNLIWDIDKPQQNVGERFERSRREME